MMNNKILIAKIIAPHGVKGNLKVRPFTVSSDDIFSYKKISDRSDNEFMLKLIGHYKDNIIVCVNNIKDRNEAEKLVGTDLYVARSEFNEPEQDQYYHSDLINLAVLDATQNKIGTVKAVHNFGAGDILEINFIDNIKDNYFLFNKENFPEVDIANKFIILMQQL